MLKYEVRIITDNRTKYSYAVHLRHGDMHRNNAPAELWNYGYWRYWKYGGCVPR